MPTNPQHAGLAPTGSRFPIDCDSSQHAPDVPGGWTADMHHWTQAMLLEHVADQTDQLLQLLERGVGDQPGNQLADELQALVYKISRLEGSERRAGLLHHLNDALLQRGVRTIVGGHGLMSYLTQITESCGPAPQSSSSLTDAAVAFFKGGGDLFHLADGTVLWCTSSSGPTQADLLQIIYGNGSALLRSLDGFVDGHPSGQVASDAELRTEFGRLLQVIARLQDVHLRNESHAELAEKLVRITSNQTLAKEFLACLSREQETGRGVAPACACAAARTDGIDSVSSLVRDNPEIEGLVADLAAQDLFRGLTATSDGYVERAVLADATVQWKVANTPDAAAYREIDRGRTLETLQAIQATGKAFMPLLWGFRVFEPAVGLFAREVNTIKAYAAMAGSLQVSVEAPLVLADIHAQHNKIPAEIYEPYYLEVERVARGLGVETIRLSAIYAKLGITLEQVEGMGPALVQKTGGNAASAVKALTELPGKYWAHLKHQARHTVARFPHLLKEVPPTYKRSEEFYGKKALHYAQFRASEGVHVLPRLAELSEANGAPVLVAHVADPTSGLLAVNGLYIRAKDNANNTVTSIPWGKPEEPAPH